MASNKTPPPLVTALVHSTVRVHKLDDRPNVSVPKGHGKGLQNVGQNVRGFIYCWSITSFDQSNHDVD